MTIAQCPKCREQVSIPTAASRRARVRCPLCSEEYLLDDALKALPPLLVVVDDPESGSSEVLLKPSHVVPATSGAYEPGEIPALVSGEQPEEFSFQPEAPAAAPAFNFESGSSVSVARPTSVAARPRRARRKESGPIRMAIQTVGGGLMGLIIAQLILWWMPGGWANENRDPAGLAKKVAKYVPAIVPASLRDDAPTAHASQPKNPATSPPRMQFGAGAGMEDGATKKSTDVDSEAATNQQPKSDRKKKTNEPKESAGNSDEFPLAGLNEPNSAEKQPTKEPNSNSPPITNIEVSKPVTKSDDTTKQGQPTETRVTATPGKDDAAAKDTADTAAAMKIAEIKAHLNEVARAEKAWDTAENPSIEKKRELITDLYVQLAQLGSTIAQAGSPSPGSGELRPVIEELNALAGRADKLVPLGRLAGMRLQEDRDKGAILVGVVLSHQTRGKMLQTQLRLLAKSDPVVTVVSPVDLAKELPVNANIIVLGRWISNPADNLAGYEGKEESVLLHGTHVAMPPTK